MLRKKLVVSAFFLAAFSATTFAQSTTTTTTYYVAQDVKTKKCTIADKKPAELSMAIVSPSGTVYKTRAEAETGMKTVKVCSSH